MAVFVPNTRYAIIKRMLGRGRIAVMPNHLFVRSVYPAWREALRTAAAVGPPVLIFFPYLKGRMAVRLLKNVPAHRCEIYTVCSIENFASGASSVQTFRELLEAGYKLFHIDGLHAKVVVVPNQYATVGSQNLTPAGSRNHEVSVGLSSAEDVEKLHVSIARWRAESRSIDLNEIRDIESHLAPVERGMQKLLDEIEAAEGAVEAAREQRKRLEADRREVMRQCGLRIQSLAPVGGVAEDVSRDFVEAAGVGRWNRDRTVKYCPWLSRHVVGPAPDWRFDLKPGSGTHKFLVARAINSCADRALQFTRDPGEDVAEGYQRLLNSLRHVVRCAVANGNDEEYKGAYGQDSRYVWLGAYGISVDAFIRRFLEKTNLAAAVNS